MRPAKEKARTAERPNDRPNEPNHAPSAGPRGELASRTLAMPTDTNPMGHVFGGWIMSLMDCAGKMTATQHSGGRVVTVPAPNIASLPPLQIADPAYRSTHPT